MPATKKKNALSLVEIASLINAHLKRFEADKGINAPRRELQNTVPFFNAWSSRAGAYIRVQYISYQGSTALTREQATAYLAKLDEGFIGRHFEALREKKARR